MERKAMLPLKQLALEVVAARPVVDVNHPHVDPKLAPFLCASYGQLAISLQVVNLSTRFQVFLASA